MVEFLHIRNKMRSKKWKQILLSKAFNVYNLRVLEHFATWNICVCLIVLTLDIAQKFLSVSSHFGIVKILFLSNFFGTNVRMINDKFGTCYNVLCYYWYLETKMYPFFMNNIYWEYYSILTTESIHKDLIKFKVFVYFNNLFV